MEVIRLSHEDWSLNFAKAPSFRRNFPGIRRCCGRLTVIPFPKSDKFTDSLPPSVQDTFRPSWKKDLGGVLVLCTSLERMRACANALGASMKDRLLVQGSFLKGEDDEKVPARTFFRAGVFQFI